MARAAELRALAAAATRELLWGLAAVRREHRRWLARASRIPDPALRARAVVALRDKRPLLDGAALFWTIPDERRPELLRLLVAFQILANYHDHAGERAWTPGGDRDPAATMDHFAQVLDLDGPQRHYWPTPDHADGGYLAALVKACREGCRTLPAYPLAREHLVLAAQRARTLDLEHEADAARRSRRLRAFAGTAFDRHEHLSWFELAAGASSLLTAIVSLALAASAETTATELQRANDTYILVATVSALLDNYVDLADDAAAGRHNYLSYYPTLDAAVARLGDLVAATSVEVAQLRHPERHAVLVAAMVAMYLTSDGARAQHPRHAALLRHDAGALTTALIPALCLWRRLNGQRGA